MGGVARGGTGGGSPCKLEQDGDSFMSQRARSTPLVEMRGIVKRFPGVLALDRVDFGLRAGEVHVLLGENGAGKTELARAVAGGGPLGSE